MQWIFIIQMERLFPNKVYNLYPVNKSLLFATECPLPRYKNKSHLISTCYECYPSPDHTLARRLLYCRPNKPIDSKSNKKGDVCMKTTHTTRTIIIAAVVLLAGATFAFAHGGWGNDGYGYGGRMGGYGGYMMGPGYGGRMMGPGYGGHMMGPGYRGDRMGPGWGRGNGRGYGYGNLTDEQRAKIDSAREKFFDETRTLRRELDEKGFELRQELNRENPDAKKAAELQKQLSKLQADFDQKAVQHRLEMRKLLPEAFQGRGYYGRGGYCWQDRD
jgi:Spy/CpxP family protein refolding chaperone